VAADVDAPFLPGKIMQPDHQPMRVRPLRGARLARLALLLAALHSPANPAWAGQAENPNPEPALPEAPRPQTTAHESPAEPGPCPVRKVGEAAKAAEKSPAASSAGAPRPAASGVNPQPGAQPAPCPQPLPHIDWYARFTNGPQVKPMKPQEKAWLAVRNIADPFNAVTILGSSAIAVGSNSHSPYGPGMTGFGRYVGVSYTQDITGEFFGTFLIPSIARQDPHYHRMPDATVKRRIAHAIYQVVWTQGDNGKGMVNYADVLGFAIDDEIGNLYVPGQKTDLPASGERYGIGLAIAPTENFVTEFLPDVARRIHVHAVLIQWIINQVARTEGQGTP
jgi:hypothetical protein